MPVLGAACLMGTGHLKRWPSSTWGQVFWKDDLILLLATRCQHQGGQIIWGYTSLENMSSLWNLLLLHRSLFYKRPMKALAELRKDSNRTILTADKGVATVVVDRKDYIDKANNLLAQPTYRTIDRDSTNKLKDKLITILRRINMESGLEDNIYNILWQPFSSPIFSFFFKWSS